MSEDAVGYSAEATEQTTGDRVRALKATAKTLRDGHEWLATIRLESNDVLMALIAQLWSPGRGSSEIAPYREAVIAVLNERLVHQQLEAQRAMADQLIQEMQALEREGSRLQRTGNRVTWAIGALGLVVALVGVLF